jgi:hypothetical protein|tara:strand:- start:1021 stop:1287 length:267 start_codon:yes stop_codon:yes gene_type:complete
MSVIELTMSKRIDLNLETKLAVEALSELPTSALATALIFSIAENLSIDNPPSDEEAMNLVLSNASLQAMQLAEGIDVIFNTEHEITRH